jgi:cell filamentation protein
MKEEGLYDVTGLIEAQYESGSDRQVLKNKLGIRSKEEMERVEAEELERTVDLVIRIYDEEHRFTAEDICNIHKIWLGDIYEWAGRYRSVNLSKPNIFFAASDVIPLLMSEFERDVLPRHTPCKDFDNERLVMALAEVHVELALIHPFREGNGRIARILSTLMALQAGLPIVDFSSIAGDKKEDYLAAVRAGLDRNYRPMERIFIDIIRETTSRL